jgi:hypothetical protein
MKLFKRLALAAGLLAFGLSPASAKVVYVKDDIGGVIIDYAKKYADMRDRGDKLVVDGRCVSACTIFLGIMPKGQYCVTPNAVLGFHSASTRKTFDDGHVEYTWAPESSVLWFNLYPGPVRKLVAKRGWDVDKPHPDVIWVAGQQLLTIAPPCNGEGL